MTLTPEELAKKDQYYEIPDYDCIRGLLFKPVNDSRQIVDSTLTDRDE
jgi:hypothetical protein